MRVVHLWHQVCDKICNSRSSRPCFREDLCYLKSGRGYLRNRTDGFVSGATFRDGCNEDPFCDRPYSFYGHQCLLFSNNYWDASIADVRRNINNSRGLYSIALDLNWNPIISEVCEELGGFLPHDYSGYAGVGGFGDQWHWVGYGASDNSCWACRPSRWREGVRAFPCSTPLSFGCQRRRAFPLPLPRRRPKIYRERITFPDDDDVLDARLGPRFRNTFNGPLAPRRNFNSVLRNNPYLYLWLFLGQTILQSHWHLLNHHFLVSRFKHFTYIRETQFWIKSFWFYETMNHETRLFVFSGCGNNLPN